MHYLRSKRPTYVGVAATRLNDNQLRRHKGSYSVGHISSTHYLTTLGVARRSKEEHSVSQ